MEKKFVKGDREYLVEVSLRNYSYGYDYVFRVGLNTRLRGNRKWTPFIDINDDKYRHLDIAQRDDNRKTSILSEIPQEWIDEVKQMEIDRISKSEYSY